MRMETEVSLGPSGKSWSLIAGKRIPLERLEAALSNRLQAPGPLVAVRDPGRMFAERADATQASTAGGHRFPQKEFLQEDLAGPPPILRLDLKL